MGLNQQKQEAKNLFIVWIFKHWITECDPELNVAEEHHVEQLYNAHYSHFLLAATEMNGEKNETTLKNYTFWLMCRIG